MLSGCTGIQECLDFSHLLFLKFTFSRLVLKVCSLRDTWVFADWRRWTRLVRETSCISWGCVPAGRPSGGPPHAFFNGYGAVLNPKAVFHKRAFDMGCEAEFLSLNIRVEISIRKHGAGYTHHVWVESVYGSWCIQHVWFLTESWFFCTLYTVNTLHMIIAWAIQFPYIFVIMRYLLIWWFHADYRLSNQMRLFTVSPDVSPTSSNVFVSPCIVRDGMILRISVCNSWQVCYHCLQPRLIPGVPSTESSRFRPEFCGPECEEVAMVWSDKELWHSGLPWEHHLQFYFFWITMVVLFSLFGHGEAIVWSYSCEAWYSWSQNSEHCPCMLNTSASLGIRDARTDVHIAYIFNQSCLFAEPACTSILPGIMMWCFGRGIQGSYMCVQNQVKIAPLLDHCRYVH